MTNRNPASARTKALKGESSQEFSVEPDERQSPVNGDTDAEDKAPERVRNAVRGWHDAGGTATRRKPKRRLRAPRTLNGQKLQGRSHFAAHAPSGMRRRPTKGPFSAGFSEGDAKCEEAAGWT